MKLDIVAALVFTAALDIRNPILNSRAAAEKRRHAGGSEKTL
jgi:hypothetical protein